MAVVGLVLSALTLVAVLAVLTLSVRAERAARERDEREQHQGRRASAALAEMRRDLEQLRAEVARLAARVHTAREEGFDDVDRGGRGRP